MDSSLGWVLDTTSVTGAYSDLGYSDSSALALGPTDGSIPPVPTWSSVYQPVNFDSGSPLRLSFAYRIDSVALDPEHLLKLYVDVLGPSGEVVETFLDQEIKRNSRVTLEEGWNTFEATLNFTQAFAGFLVFSAEYDGISDRGTLLIDEVSLCSADRSYGNAFEESDRAIKSLSNQTHNGVIVMELKTARLEANQIDEVYQHNLRHLSGDDSASQFLVAQEPVEEAVIEDESDEVIIVSPPKLPEIEEAGDELTSEIGSQGITSNGENILVQLDLVEAMAEKEAVEPLAGEELDVRAKVLVPIPNDHIGPRLLLWLLPAMALFFFGAFMVMSIIVITKGWELFFPK